MKNVKTKNSQNYGIYLIYDSLAEAYGVPFVAPTNSVALRGTAMQFAGVSSMAISDIKIFEIGQFCIETGELEVYPKGTEECIATSEDILNEVERLKSFIESVKNSVENENGNVVLDSELKGGNE